MKYRILILSVICGVMTIMDNSAYAKKKRGTTEVQKTPYEKLLDVEGVQTKRGMISIHKIKDKLYFELPVALVGRDMLLTTTIKEISDNGESPVGYTPNRPLHIVFEKHDSSVYIALKDWNYLSEEIDDNALNAVNKSNIPAILQVFKIKCYNNDKSTIVFDATDLFLKNKLKVFEPFDPTSFSVFMGMGDRKSKLMEESCLLKDFRAFEDNVSIDALLAYKLDLTFWGFTVELGKHATALVSRSFMLLPEKPMMSRLVDPRIGVSYVRKRPFGANVSSSETEYYAQRWRIEPSDKNAYEQGQPVEPIKPIVYYIDTLMPSQWVESVREGIMVWNKAFERIGFKNVLQVRSYPVNDPEFDPNNLKYNCVGYSPLLIGGIDGHNWTDPRSGEILNSSFLIYHNTSNIWFLNRINSTGLVDKEARKSQFGDPYSRENIKLAVSRHIGKSLGLLGNYISSTAYPTDSLRSPSFTQKYGISPSVMDGRSFNYVAQPGDKERGVVMSPPVLGEYDCYVVDWLYEPVKGASTPKDELPALRKKITQRMNDPIYRFGKRQRYMYDPRCQFSDLGDDVIKSALYGIENIKRSIPELKTWLSYDDPTGDRADGLYYTQIDMYRQYLVHMINFIGGIYLNEKCEGDSVETYSSVPKETQRYVVKYLCEQLKDLSWADNRDLYKKIELINDYSTVLRDQIIGTIIASASSVEVAQSKDPKSYTVNEYLADISEFVWGNALNYKPLTPNERSSQVAFVQTLLSRSGTLSEPSDIYSGVAIKPRMSTLRTPMSLTLERFSKMDMEQAMYAYSEEKLDPDSRNAYNIQSEIRVSIYNTPTYYTLLLNAKNIIQSNLSRAKGDDKIHYDYLLFKINQALDKK